MSDYPKIYNIVYSPLRAVSITPLLEELTDPSVPGSHQISLCRAGATRAAILALGEPDYLKDGAYIPEARCEKIREIADALVENSVFEGLDFWGQPYSGVNIEAIGANSHRGIYVTTIADGPHSEEESEALIALIERGGGENIQSINRILYLPDYPSDIAESGSDYVLDLARRAWEMTENSSSPIRQIHDSRGWAFTIIGGPLSSRVGVERPYREFVLDQLRAESFSVWDGEGSLSFFNLFKDTLQDVRASSRFKRLLNKPAISTPEVDFTYRMIADASFKAVDEFLDGFLKFYFENRGDLDPIYQKGYDYASGAPQGEAGFNTGASVFYKYCVRHGSEPEDPESKAGAKQVEDFKTVFSHWFLDEISLACAEGVLRDLTLKSAPAFLAWSGKGFVKDGCPEGEPSSSDIVLLDDLLRRGRLAAKAKRNFVGDKSITGLIEGLLEACAYCAVSVSGSPLSLPFNKYGTLPYLYETLKKHFVYTI